ncbi:response regulator [Amycolatopsis dendrobii]|uniref:Transcriptional regulatory protein n=1 Tax=Amycolatopsis dendrobii TaxID=2760662 RepID=A0A7W3ZB32_9PSEU|nr:response regulator [Amycolatopsis dendrobii]MBB1154439.1 response regulator [Amycolatopsis dendrobii]
MIDVLVVEDDLAAQEIHAQEARKVPGFRVVGVAGTARDALRFCEQHHVDVILLDFRLPDADGLSVCQALRAENKHIDVIAVTSVRDLATVRAAVSHGVVQYLLKPFRPASLRNKLASYAEFRRQATRPGEVTGQAEVDAILGTLRKPAATTLPKGMNVDTLSAVVAVVKANPEGLSAASAAAAAGVSRVTARRYLEHLVEQHAVERRHRYGKVGRPEVMFYPSSR